MQLCRINLFNPRTNSVTNCGKFYMVGQLYNKVRLVLQSWVSIITKLGNFALLESVVNNKSGAIVNTKWGRYFKIGIS